MAPVGTIPEELIHTSPPPAPFWDYYEFSDDIATDLETRRGADFNPEGTNIGIDENAAERHETRNIFTMHPKVFGHCRLIRDYAEPLRVGNALVHKATQPGKFSFLQEETDHNSNGEDFVQGEMLKPEGAISNRDVTEEVSYVCFPEKHCGRGQ